SPVLIEHEIGDFPDLVAGLVIDRSADEIGAENLRIILHFHKGRRLRRGGAHRDHQSGHSRKSGFHRKNSLVSPCTEYGLKILCFSITPSTDEWRKDGGILMCGSSKRPR